MFLDPGESTLNSTPLHPCLCFADIDIHSRFLRYYIGSCRAVLCGLAVVCDVLSFSVLLYHSHFLFSLFSSIHSTLSCIISERSSEVGLGVKVLQTSVAVEMIATGTVLKLKKEKEE